MYTILVFAMLTQTTTDHVLLVGAYTTRPVTRIPADTDLLIGPSVPDSLVRTTAPAQTVSVPVGSAPTPTPEAITAPVVYYTRAVPTRAYTTPTACSGGTCPAPARRGLWGRTR